MNPITSILLSGLASITLAQPTDEAYMSAPTFKEIERFVGGTWHGKFPNGLTIDLRFQYAAGGKVVRGDGSVKKDGTPVVYMHPSLGWDPVKKSVMYLDMHDNDTVYLGNVDLKDGWLVFDFVNPQNPAKHLSAHERFTGPNSYEFTLGDKVIQMKRSLDMTKD